MSEYTEEIGKGILANVHRKISNDEYNANNNENKEVWSSDYTVNSHTDIKQLYTYKT